MNRLIASGSLLLVIGVVAFAIPVFTTETTSDVANLGGLKLQSTEKTEHSIPPPVGGIAVTLGAILLVAGLSRKRG